MYLSTPSKNINKIELSTPQNLSYTPQMYNDKKKSKINTSPHSHFQVHD